LGGPPVDAIGKLVTSSAVAKRWSPGFGLSVLGMTGAVSARSRAAGPAKGNCVGKGGTSSVLGFRLAFVLLREGRLSPEDAPGREASPAIDLDL
jgi:hypothetical protein